MVEAGKRVWLAAGRDSPGATLDARRSELCKLDSFRTVEFSTNILASHTRALSAPRFLVSNQRISVFLSSPVTLLVRSVLLKYPPK